MSKLGCYNCLFSILVIIYSLFYVFVAIDWLFNFIVIGIAWWRLYFIEHSQLNGDKWNSSITLVCLYSILISTSILRPAFEVMSLRQSMFKNIHLIISSLQLGVFIALLVDFYDEKSTLDYSFAISGITVLSLSIIPYLALHSAHANIQRDNVSEENQHILERSTSSVEIRERSITPALIWRLSF